MKIDSIEIYVKSTTGLAGAVQELIDYSAWKLLPNDDTFEYWLFVTA